MNIVHVIQTFSLGGGPRALYYLCMSMPDVDFIIYGKNGMMVEDFQKLSNVKLHFVENWDLNTTMKIQKECIENKIDLIHFHNIFPAIYFSLFNKIPKIVTFHGIHVRKYDYINNSCKRYMRVFIKNLLIKSFDAVISLCETDKEYLKKILLSKEDTKKIHVIPNAIMLEKFDTRTNVEFNEEYTNLIMVARHDFQKGHDILLKILKKVIMHFPTLRVYFAGDKKVESLLQEQKELFNQYIFYLGETNSPYHYIKKADYLILPSRWEGLPMVVLESLLLGTKVIAADTANVNWLADNRNIYTYKQFDDNDLIRVLKVCMVNKGLKVDYDLSQFSLKTVGEKTRLLYQEIMGIC